MTTAAVDHLVSRLNSDGNFQRRFEDDVQGVLREAGLSVDVDTAKTLTALQQLSIAPQDISGQRLPFPT